MAKGGKPKKSLLKPKTGRPRRSMLSPATRRVDPPPDAAPRAAYRFERLATSELVGKLETKCNVMLSKGYRYKHCVHVGGNDSLVCFEREGG
jgi:hypothetical protein